jgi:arylamine N-acetyltransferase
VAYENIDIHAGRPAPPLAAAVCAERVALQQRGGYCFIVVPAFGAMGYMTSFRHARPSVVLL